jgi:hypothetical protein
VSLGLWHAWAAHSLTVFRRLRIDDTFYSGAPRRALNPGKNGRAGAAAGGEKDGVAAGGAGRLAPRRFARSQGSVNMSATYDSRTNDVESSVVARGDLWRAEASHGSSAPRGAGASAGRASLFLVQLGPVLFVRDTTLLFPVHLSKRILIWYGFERKVRRSDNPCRLQSVLGSEQTDRPTRALCPCRTECTRCDLLIGQLRGDASSCP